MSIDKPRRGIIGAMTNQQFDETRPTQISAQAEEDERLDLSQTRPVSTGEQATPNSGETMPTPHLPDEQDLSAYEETSAVPVGSQPPVEEESDNDNLAETRLTPVKTAADSPPPSETPPESPAPRRPISLRIVTLLGFLLIILAGVLSALGGYSSGIGQRQSAEATQVSLYVSEQFELGLQDIEAKRYDLARQRFEYVIQLEPGYPGVTEKLSDVLLELNTTATPTSAPTPTLTPTPDTRNVDELFREAQEDLNNQDWSAAIDTLLALRKADAAYQPVWVDDKLYVAFRNRGTDKILVQGDLEGGIYDLTVAERIGPLDADAKSYLDWARIYIRGASFWEIDWGQAVFYFAQVAPALPNLRDGSDWTAVERYRQALVGYAGFLGDNKRWCEAVEQYDLALSMGSDATVEEARDFASEKCGGGGDDDDGRADEPESNNGEEQPPAATDPPATEEPAPEETPYP